VSKGRARLDELVDLIDWARGVGDGAWEECECAINAIAADLDECESLRADLLATRRALKMAQARALKVQAFHWRQQFNPWACTGSPKHWRRARLLEHYAAKFEREAGEM
jgi:hypothetical protein